MRQWNLDKIVTLIAINDLFKKERRAAFSSTKNGQDGSQYALSVPTIRVCVEACAFSLRFCMLV